jgi:hypothetical protein
MKNIVKTAVEAVTGTSPATERIARRRQLFERLAEVEAEERAEVEAAEKALADDELAKLERERAAKLEAFHRAAVGRRSGAVRAEIRAAADPRIDQLSDALWARLNTERSACDGRHDWARAAIIKTLAANIHELEALKESELDGPALFVELERLRTTPDAAGLSAERERRAYEESKRQDSEAARAARQAEAAWGSGDAPETVVRPGALIDGTLVTGRGS